MMKTKSLIIAMMGMFLFSCSSDDSNSPTINPAGVYKMTAFNTSVATDLNGNGTTSTNQMTETSCFDNNYITINSDKTFTSTQNGLEIGFDGTNDTLDCYTDPSISGTWTINGNTLSLHYTDGTEVTDDYKITSTTLKLTVANGEIVGTANGDPVYLTSNIEVVYTKQ